MSCYIPIITEEENTTSRKLTKSCRKHKCPYLKYLSTKSSVPYCSYLLKTGHSRIKDEANRDPNNCTLWKTENV